MERYKLLEVMFQYIILKPHLKSNQGVLSPHKKKKTKKNKKKKKRKKKKKKKEQITLKSGTNKTSLIKLCKFQ